jgi:hypothetical protein
MIGRGKKGGKKADSSELQKLNYDMSQYGSFVRELINDLIAGTWTIVKFVAFPDGTFGLNTTLAATGKDKKYHIEIREGACPHCIIEWTLFKNLMAEPRLNFDTNKGMFAIGTYRQLLEQLRLPELFVMHKQTLQGQAGRLMQAQVQGDWATDVAAAEQQPSKMPFTGNCPTHAFNGR